MSLPGDVPTLTLTAATSPPTNQASLPASSFVVSTNHLAPGGSIIPKRAATSVSDGIFAEDKEYYLRAKEAAYQDCQNIRSVRLDPAQSRSLTIQTAIRTAVRKYAFEINDLQGLEQHLRGIIPDADQQACPNELSLEALTQALDIAKVAREISARRSNP